MMIVFCCFIVIDRHNSQLSQRLMKCFFSEIPNSIASSTLSTAFWKQYQTPLFMIDESLEKYISTHFAHVISAHTNSKKEILFGFKHDVDDRNSYSFYVMFVYHLCLYVVCGCLSYICYLVFAMFVVVYHVCFVCTQISSYLKNLNFETRKLWMRSKIMRIVKQHKFGISFNCLVKKILYFAKFDICDSSLMSADNHRSGNPPLILLQNIMTDEFVIKDMPYFQMCPLCFFIQHYENIMKTAMEVPKNSRRLSTVLVFLLFA